MTIDLYYLSLSAPCRVVQLAAKIIGVDLNLKPTDLRKGEHLTPEYLKLNPQHTIPTLVDDGFSVWESRAIITYLQNKYGKDDSLYPKEPKGRAAVDQKLYFDAATLYSSVSNYYFALFLGKPLDPAKLEPLNKALTFLETFLEKSEYIAGNNLTLADISLVGSVSSLDAFGHDLSSYKNVTRWYSKIKTKLPGFEEIVTKPVEDAKKMFKK